jgi:hypothetical protein
MPVEQVDVHKSLDELHGHDPGLAHRAVETAQAHSGDEGANYLPGRYADSAAFHEQQGAPSHVSEGLTTLGAASADQPMFQPAVASWEPPVTQSEPASAQPAGSPSELQTQPSQPSERPAPRAPSPVELGGWGGSPE